MEKIRIGFLGYGTRALDALMADERFDVRYFIAPISRVDECVYKARKDYPTIPFHYVKDNAELAALFEKYNEADIFLMNACPIILKESVLKIKDVYNIHPGSLLTNRGHQPHQWTVLLGEEKSEIVCYKVALGIDEGLLVGRCEENIPKDADALQVLDLLEDRIPNLLDKLYEHLTADTPFVKECAGGDYRQNLDHHDYQIIPEDIGKAYFYDDMMRKIRARVMNHGAFIQWEGKRIYADTLLYEEAGSQEVGVRVHGKCVFLEGCGKRYILRLNHIEPVEDL